jgi:DNA invertase Pin-like site-specific DNA recombinase
MTRQEKIAAAVEGRRRGEKWDHLVAAYGIPQTTLRWAALRAGIIPQPAERRNKTPPEKAAEVMRLLHNGMIPKYVAQQLGLGRDTVRRIARDNGFPPLHRYTRA